MLDQAVLALDIFRCFVRANITNRGERWNATQMPELSGRVAIVTGGNNGIGYATCLELARHGAKVYMASRSEQRARTAIQKIKETVPKAEIEFLGFDLTILSTAKKAATEFTAKENRLDILINNAGIFGTPFQVSQDGIELQACNCTGHFALTMALLPTLERTSSLPDAHVRIVNVSSVAHAIAATPDFSSLEGLNYKSGTGSGRYAMSKLYSLLFNNELQERLKHTNIHCLAVHPGFVETGIADHMLPSQLRSRSASAASSDGRKSFLVSLFEYYTRAAATMVSDIHQGALTQLYAATSPDVEVKNLRGAYLVPYGQVGMKGKWARDDDGTLGKALWILCENLVAEAERRELKT